MGKVIARLDSVASFGTERVRRSAIGLGHSLVGGPFATVFTCALGVVPALRASFYVESVPVTPSSSCKRVLVVVYCSSTGLSVRYSAIEKPASVAS